MSKDISISEFIKAKTELRNNIRDAILMFVEDFYNRTGVWANGDISFKQQYYDEETESTCETKHLGMTIEVSLVTDVEYDD